MFRVYEISAHALLFQVFLFLLHFLKHDLVLYFPSLCHPGASSAVNIYISLHSRLKIWALWKLQTHSSSSVMSSVSRSVGSECIYEWNDPLITLFTDSVALCSLVGIKTASHWIPTKKEKKQNTARWMAHPIKTSSSSSRTSRDAAVLPAVIQFANILS